MLLTAAWFAHSERLADNQASNRVVIIPQPKLVRTGAGELKIADSAKWSLTSSSRDERLWETVKHLIRSENGNFRSGSNSTVVQIGAVPRSDLPVRDQLPEWASNPEGYQLVTSSNGITIISSTSQGAFYGLQTLAQLLDRTSTGWTCPIVKIQDWPSMRFRGAHWFPSASDFPMHMKLIGNVLAPLKLNNSVIQCEAARWDKHPEIVGSNSISKADLGRLVQACRAAYIEPIPLVNTPGHAEWLFRNGNNLDLAEDPDAAYAYCVRNPRSYEFVEDVFSECIQIFRPMYFHLGHDEVTMRGRFPNPNCPRCNDATVAGLIGEHAARLKNWFEKQDIRTMIWGDMLLGPGEAADATHAKTVEDARERRSKIPKGTTIVDWHYAEKADARSLKIFQQGGFNVIAATFWSPNNIYNFSQAALEARAEGLLQTTWMGYFPDERAMRNELRQFVGFVLAAEYAWSGKKDAPAQLGYDAGKVFKALYDRNR